MRSSQPPSSSTLVQEITGKPGNLIGKMIVPASGSITVRIVGDMLQATTKGSLEKRESWTRIQNIDCAEIVESPIWQLLAIGIPLLLAGLPSVQYSSFGGLLLLAGIGCIAAFFLVKRRYLAIYSSRNTIPVFIQKPSKAYHQFAMTVMAIARQLNAQPAPMMPNEQVSGRTATAFVK
ncbi:hypothetical protein H6F88_17605 [Oculatella sp. FACHB-28]|uniref:hypothetical protein n=1 Tax=Oculatella sp. FACHB-28 TaxID=2692845 RepID=UPI00168A3287|nr:hypothetical protein [Oculatella sp. FACHB-28]MBD2057813.1 hypothetical protein [Oculatella sp. FACHB-28]